MNFAEIETLWRSPQNRPSPAQLEEIKMEFVTDLKKRRRALVTFLAMIGAALLALTAVFSAQLIWPNPGKDAIDVSREWSVIPFFAIPWVGWIVLVRNYRRHRDGHPDYENSIASSVRALLDENRMERARYKLITALQVATLIVLPVVVYQLRSVGKAGDEILVPAFVIFPAILVGVLGAGAWRYRRKLLPRKRELEGLLATYESAG